MKYGYARVSTNEQELAYQLEQLKNAGAEKIYSEKYTGTTRDRPKLDELLSIISKEDELIVTKLDRLSRSVQQGTALISELQERGIIVNILNMGRIDNTPNGSLMLNMFLAFAQFERDMIVQRTQEGREYQRKNNPNYRDGRKPKKTPQQIKQILEYLKKSTYTETARLFEIDKSTIVRYKQRYGQNNAE
jgi:Site-specific recombinases, DNA invertase Pin homologs